MILVVVLLAAWFVSSSPILHAAAYGRLVTPDVKERDASVPLVDQSQARIVTDALAAKRGAEVLVTSTEAGLGSRVKVGEAWGNKIGDTMYWVMPLEHSGFTRWLSHGTTPGFIAVSQMNEMNTKFVQDKPLRIGVNAFMDDNVYRHLFNRGFTSQVFGEAVFEVDDEWNPYWVVPLLLPQIGAGADIPVGWSLVNAVTGDVQTYYHEADVPKWVDRLYHRDQIADSFDDWGCWSQGVMACMFTGNEVIVGTPGNNVTIDAHHDIVYYSGTQFQNGAADGATSGFFTANARTGQITFYRRAGITETAAKSVMRGAYADFEGYEPADCVLLTINGEAAYFSIIVDAAGSRKAFAVVSQTNRNIFGKGSSIQAALTDFGRSTQRAGRDAAFEPGKGAAGLSFSGRVVTMNQIVQNDRTSFYLTIDTVPGKIFEISEEKVGEIVATKPGDAVVIGADNEEPAVILSTGFDNVGFDLKDGPVQKLVDERNEEAFRKALDQVRPLPAGQLQMLRTAPARATPPLSPVH